MAKKRETYDLTFPADMRAEQVATWLRAMSGTLTTGPRRLLGVSSIAMEVGASEQGITYRLWAPEETAHFVVSQLRSGVPGSTAQPAAADEPRHSWTTAVELGQANPRRSLGGMDAASLSASLLTNMQGLGQGEALLLQWVVSPAIRERSPQAPAEEITPRSMGRLMGSRVDRDLVADRRAKLSEPNFLAVLRVAVKANASARADQLLAQLQSSLASVGGADNRLKRRLVSSRRVVERVHQAAVPTVFPAVLAASELVGLLAWPIGNPYVAGLPASRTRQLVATGTIPRRGRVIARSNFPGNERLLALSPAESTWHLQVVGPTGSGKSEPPRGSRTAAMQEILIPTEG